MKRCLTCDTLYGGETWKCPACGAAPLCRDGFPLFAPGRATLAEGFGEGGFAALAEVEGASFWFRNRNDVIAWAVREYFPGARHVFEAGCGSGFVLSSLRRRFPQFEPTGAEIAVDALHIARSRLPDARLIQADATNLPFKEEFDLVGAFDVLEHVDEDERALEQLHGALRPGGGLIVTVPQHPWLWSALDELGAHKRRYTRSLLEQRVRAAGFAIVRTTSFVSVLLPAMALSRFRLRGNAQVVDPLSEFRLPKAVDRALSAALALERRAIARGVSLPAGGSILLVAERG